jgi:hypothetical protein
MNTNFHPLHSLVRSAIVSSALLACGLAAHASDLMPSFASGAAGWTTDRFQPNSFSNVGTYQGRNPVLGIGIDEAQAMGNRGTGFNTQFYNTQGMIQAVVGGAGDSISADLYIPSSWANAANGSRRSDMWAVMGTGPSVAERTDYPIIGFTNYNGTARLRVYDADTPNFWVDLSTPIVYDAWTAFKITFTGTSYEYSVNGALVYTDATINSVAATSVFNSVIMQAYNFNGDASLASAVTAGGLGNYTAYWSNAQPVPEPGTYALMALGLAAVLTAAKRRRLPF